MESYSIQALGESSLSDSESVNDDSTTVESSSRAGETNDATNTMGDKHETDMDAIVEDEATLRVKRKDDLCEKYKDGLKLLAFENFLEAEKLFESLINDSILDKIEHTVVDEVGDEKELIQLKYAILKNLALINRDKTHNYSKALDCIIKAAKIDSTDPCLWFDMGDSAMRLGKYIIARHAFEECFRLNSTYWECIDKLIVLLYALGNYHLCLKYLIYALKLDKFYTNGLILLKKYESTMLELDYPEIVQSFIDSDYTQLGLDIDTFLSQMPEQMYLDLMDRIDEIKSNYKNELLTTQMSSSKLIEENNSVTIPEHIISWESLGNYILRLDETSKLRFDLPLKVTLKGEDSDLQNSDVKTSAKEEDGNNAKTAAAVAVKRKAKVVEANPSEEGWLKRRSLRKGNEKSDQSMTFLEILKKFFDENLLKDQQTEIASPCKKPSHMEAMKKISFGSIQDDEEVNVRSLVDTFRSKETSLFDMYKLYLTNLAINYDKKWYGQLEGIYIRMVDSFNRKYNIIEALSTYNRNEFVDFCSIMIVYMEIQFSKYKDLKQKRKEDEHLDHDEKSKMSRLISQVYELDFHMQRFRKSIGQSEDLDTKMNIFTLRVWCVLLYASIEFSDEQISTDYFVDKINNHLVTNDALVVKVANSAVFSVISKEAMKEFLRVNKRNKIMRLGELIGQMFESAKYDEIIESLEDFADTQKLAFGDDSFRSVIYLQLLESYLNLTPAPEMEKFMYFVCKFLRQLLKYLNDESLQVFSQTTTDQKRYEDTVKHMSVASDFLFRMLDLLRRALEIIEKKKIGYNLSSAQRGELVWLMNQLVSMYYDQNNELALKLDLTRKPVGMFQILFALMVDIDESDRTEYLTLVHDYLARNGLCGLNNGEIIMWSIEVLNMYKSQCAKCNSSSNNQEVPNKQEQQQKHHHMVRQESSTTLTAGEEEASNNNTQQSTATTSSSTSSSSSSSTMSSSASSHKSCICSEFDELLEQSFYCLFGFRKKTAKYLNTHSVVKQPYDLRSAALIYAHFKPARLPEYDDRLSASISSEFNEFLNEVLRLICEEAQTDSYETTLEAIKATFISGLQTQNFSKFDQLFDSLSYYSQETELKFRDIFYLIGDYHLKNEKKADKRKLMVLNYYIKDLSLNPTRFDSWAALALFTKEDVLDDYFEIMLNLKTQSDLDKFLESIYLSINLFRKSLEYIRASDQTFTIEYGSFLYQLSSFCSRQLKTAALIAGYFSASAAEAIETKLKEKRIKLLHMSLEVYKEANDASMATKKPHHAPSAVVANEAATTAVPDTTESSSSVIIVQQQPASEVSGGEANAKSKSTAVKTQSSDDADEDWGEEWLHHYMFGKIKEKLSDVPLLECLEHYKKSYDYLEKRVTVYLKRISYKSKSCDNLECNEVLYRIYALTLKRLVAFNSTSDSAENMKSLLSFLERVIQVKFVQVHDDFSLADTEKFIVNQILSKSKRINSVPNKELFVKCVVICVAGLNHILKRFPQHYRSMFRLAHFYSKFLDLRGIWRISSNTKEEQQDFERGGSFSNHLFKSVHLLVEILAKIKQTSDLIEISKSFYQKQDPEKKYLKDDVQKEFIANLSLTKTRECLEAIANQKFKTEFSDENDLLAYQNDLVPLLLDAYETHKLASKHNETLCAPIYNLLVLLFYQFNPMHIKNQTRVSMDEINKFCQMIEKKDKANKAAKAKATATNKSTTVTTNSQAQATTSQISSQTINIQSTQSLIQ